MSDVGEVSVKITADASGVDRAISNVKGQFSQLSNDLTGIAKGFNLDNVASQFDRVAGGMQKMGAAMSLMGVPMGLLAKESIGMFADLESQIQRNTALLNGGKAEYEQILALSKELGASSPFDALEISKGIESLAAAGYSLQEIQAAMPTITNMAVATGEDLNSMSEILVATLNSYGEAADKAGVYGDKLATIANISSAGVTDFGESIKYVGGVVKAFGVDIDELGAVLGALADVNIKGSAAGTALRSIITDLVSPTAAVNDIFASFGLTMDELNPKTNDFVEILQKMKDAGVSDEALMAAFQDRGGPVAIQMMNQLDKIKENYNTLQNESAGMLEDFAAQMRDSLKFVMDEMGGTISNIMIEIGEGLKPIVEEIGAWLNENQDTLVEFAKNAVDGLTPFVTKFMDLAKKLMDWFNSLPKDLQSKIAGLTGLGGAMATIGGPLLLLGSLPVSGIAKIAGALKELFSLGNAAGGIAGAGKATASVVPLVRSLAQLAETTPKIAGVTQYLVPIGPAAAGAASEVGLLTAALATLGGPGIAALAGVGLGLAAYATNFGDFRDNVNSVISELGQAAQNISSGDYEAAGRDCAEAFGKGLETVVDLTVSAIEGLPDAATALGDFKAGFDVAAGEIVQGFTSRLTTDLYNGITSIQLPSIGPQTILTKEAYEANMNSFIEDIKSSFANIDLTSAGASIVGTLFSGMSGAIPGLSGTLTSVLEGAMKGTFGTVSNFFLDSIAEKFGMSPSEIQSMLEGQGPLGLGDKLSEWYGESYKKDTSDPDRIIKKYYDDLIAQGITPTAAQTQAENQYYQNRAAHSGDYLNSGEVTTATESGTKTGAEAGTEAGAKAGVESIIPSIREWVEKQGKQGLSDAELEKYRPLYNKEYGLAAKATKEETEAKEKGTKELINFSGSLEEATRAAIAANEKGSWTNNGKTYKINQNTGLAESQELTDIIAQNKADALAKEAAKQTKADENARISAEKIHTSVVKSYDDYIDKYQDTLEDLDASDKNYSKKLAKAKDDFHDSVEELNEKYNTNLSTDISNAQKSLNDYKAANTDIASVTKDTTKATQDYSTATKTASDNILNFSDPVKVATNNVFTFGPAVSSATEALLQVPGAIDKILNVESPAMDSLAESRSKQLQQDFDANVNSSDLKKSITEYLTESAYWTTKTAIGSGHTEDSYIYQDNLKGDLLAQLIEMQNPVDFAPSGWARRTQASEWLSSQNAGTQTQYLQIVDDLMTRLEQIDFYEGVKSGKVKAVAEEGEVDIGHLSRRVDIVGLDGLNTGVEKTGTEAKTTTPQINTLNSAFEKIGLTGSGLTNVLSNVDQALSDHHANILESKDYLTKYNDAAGQNTKYTQDQERQTYSLMNSLGMLGTAQDMYNNYMSDGVLDATEAASVQQALAAATKMMGDAGITAEGGISGLPGALQALASAAQAAMSQIQAAISQAQSAASAAASGWKMQTSPTKYPTMAPSSPTNFNINMNNNTFPTGTNPGEVFSTFVNGTRVIGV